MSQMPNSGTGGTDWDDSTWAAWAVSLVEPLVDAQELVEMVDAMRHQAAANMLRAGTLLAGALTDLVDSLPDSDPWHRVDSNTFGTWRDGTDLVPLESADLREDIGLAALAKPLSQGGVRLLCEARHGWEAVAHLAYELDDPVDDFTQAIKWVSWRRRAYLGEDNYPVLVMFSWLRRAALIAAGSELDDDVARERMRESAKIADDLL